jgi:SHS2 domain-containing protein
VFPDDQSIVIRNAPSAHEQVPRWEHFAHQADIGIRGIGRSVEEAFEQAGMALTAVMVAPEAVQLKISATIECEASDLDVLFVDWLNAIVFEMATSRMLFGAYHISIDETRLAATAVGELVDPARHEPAVEIKGATYTALRVERQSNDTWVAQCVVDV